MVSDILLTKQKICDPIQGINQSKKVNQHELFGEIYISSLKPRKTCRTQTTKEQDFKHQLFWGHTYEIKNTFCGHLGSSSQKDSKNITSVTKKN